MPKIVEILDLSNNDITTLDNTAFIVRKGNTTKSISLIYKLINIF